MTARDRGPSERQIEVLRLVAHGYTNAAIGRELFVCEDTVKTHLRHLYRILRARDRAHAVHIAYQTGLLRVGRRHDAGDDEATAS